MSKSELLEIYLDKSNTQEKRLFTCALCPYRTDRRNNLKRHTATMHEQSAAILECCGTRFANKAALRHHTAAYHRHGYICTICGRVFCRRALLRRHHAVHSGYKEFTCSVCDYATSHKSNLERHMKIHEGGDKFSGVGVLKGSSSHLNRSLSSPEYCPERWVGTPGPRDHNPILASLLSQPGHGEVLQWSYHPNIFDYGVPTYNYAVAPTPAVKTEPYWSHSMDGEFFHPRRAEGGRILPESGTIPLRHAIDVILGVKEEVPASPATPATPESFFYPSPGVITTASNHWSVGHVSCTVDNDLLDGGDVLMFTNTVNNIRHFSDSGVESDNSPVDYRRQWSADSADVNGDGEVVIVDDAASSSADPEDDAYVPKKLRMSKRYQSLYKC